MFLFSEIKIIHDFSWGEMEKGLIQQNAFITWLDPHLM